MSEKIKERHNKMTHDMYEEKEHYKMYKSGDHWVSAKIATIAGVALFSTAILGVGNQANADTVSSATPSTTQVASSKSSSSATTSQSSSSSKGMNVDVPHGDLDNAVSNAKKDGVQVSQDATTQTTTDANKASQAESSIANDYKNQTDVMNKADAQQKQVSSARNTANNHSNVDSAVKQAQSVGVQVNKGADQAIKGNPADAQKVQSQITDDYNSQVKSLQDATNQQKQVNAAKDTANNHSNVDNAVKQAQAAGVNVTKDSDKTISGNASDAQKIQGQISGDYNSEVQDIQNAISQQKQYDQAYQQAMDQYNKALDDYNKQKANYDKAVSGLNNQGIAMSGIDPSSITQKLILNKTPNATVKVLSSSPNVKVSVQDNFDNSKAPEGVDSKQLITVLANNGLKGVDGNVITVEYDGDFGSYNGDKITKIVRTYKDLQPWVDPNASYVDIGNGNKATESQMYIYSDPTDGFWYDASQGVTTSTQYYDDSGKQITFNQNDAYMTIESLNHHKNWNNDSTAGDPIEKAQLLSSGKADQIKGSSVTVHDGNTLYSDQVNDQNSETWDVTGSTEEYYGAGIFQMSGNTVDIKWSTSNPKVGYSVNTWVESSTTIPYIPSAPGNPPTQPKKQQASVSYHYDVANIAPVQANYHYDIADIPNVQASYHYDGLTITPVETKNVTANNQNINGKKVVKDENVSFPLSSAPLPANRTDDVKTLTFTDTLDKNVKFDSWKAVDAKGNDVSKDFTMSQNGQTVTFTATQDFMNQINSNKGSQFDLPTINIAATATASGVQIDNTFEIHVNGNAWPSNKVEFSTPGVTPPVKTVDDKNGKDINGNFVEPGQDVIFGLTMDLTNDTQVVLDKNAIAKGLDMTDTVDKRLTPEVNDIVIKDGNGKEISKDLFNITDNDNVVKIAVKDPQAFLNTYGGQKIQITLPTKVNTGITGNIPNTVVENHFGDHPKSNQVIVYVPNPTKGVAAGTIQGNSSVSIDGKNVVQGQDITFTLNTTDLPAGRKEDVKTYQAVDKLDPNFDYTGFRAFLGNTDVTDQFTPTLTKDANGQWTVTFTASSALVDAMNKDKSKAFTVPTIDIYGKAIKGGTTIKNSYVEKINNANWTSNTVSVNTEKPGTPVKVVDNADGQDANNGNVARGDALIYHVSMDLTNLLKDTVLTPNMIAKGLWITDKMPNGVTVNTAGIRVNSADGKDITSQFTITDEGSQIKVAAKDPAAIIKEYGGTKLDITIPTTVNDDFTGDITNTATQNTFGNIMESNTVVNHVPPMNPTKDVVVDLGNQNSLNGKEIALNSTFEYKLNSSTRSEDYTGKTTEWGMQDHLDTKHDEFTGQWQVIADHPFALKDGTTIKAGSDISKYFTMTYDTKTGEIDVEATKDFLDIMNLPANKKTEQGWSVFLQCKRIASGTAYNTFSETYNGRVKNSNTVKTTTPEPKKPETPKTPETSVKTPAPVKTAPVQPAKPAPAVAEAQPKATPVAPVLAAPAPVKATPAPAEKQAMPQTGEEENNEAALVGLAALGMVGMMGLGLRKKRYED